eukprot:5334722-Prymnesium_polylepis.2
MNIWLRQRPHDVSAVALDQAASGGAPAARARGGAGPGGAGGAGRSAPRQTGVSRVYTARLEVTPTRQREF